MVLNAEKWEVSVPESFYSVIIEVKVGHLKLLSTWHTLTRSPDCKSVSDVRPGPQDRRGAAPCRFFQSSPPVPRGTPFLARAWAN